MFCLAILLDDRPRVNGLAFVALPISAARGYVTRVLARDDPCVFSVCTFLPPLRAWVLLAGGCPSTWLQVEPNCSQHAGV